ncbi:mucin-2 isoform X1 [Drosophila nasuta]|uniref:mucin-2 isoform X1 n=1 Tax=Drosophila nasuta TaxID=42062 RepID=UPI00295F0F8E|nr:mucin-2 isoform X1 [Drosophila nasuta]XP_060666419.1 mucin-2 isoform X1 [Drosophila nasuta]
MLHNIDDNAAPTATLTSTSATLTAATATTMAPTETTGNGTEPTISTHLANATATIEPTTAATTAPSATEEETNTAAANVVVAASVAPTVEGQATAAAATTMTVTANNTNTNTNAATQPQSLSTSTSALSAVAEEQQLPELAKTAIALYASSADDVQMRTQQQQKIKIYHGAKQSAVWRTDSLASNPSPNLSQPNSVTSCSETKTVVPISSSRSSGGYSTAPSLLQRKFSDSSFAATATAMPRRVSFPESDKELVTGYLEPANPWEQAYQVSSIAEIFELYEQSCAKHHTKPMKNILDHLKSLDLSLTRQPVLSLKGINLSPNDCEPLEEIFKRIQYKVIDLSECLLDESCLSALCQMIEYYEAANELDISYNRDPMTVRGWNLCTYMVGRSQELQLLNAEGNQISKVGAENLGHSLTTSNLHTLKLEHCGLKGPPLTSFCYQLYHNKILKELWLGYNDLDCTDAEHIAGMLRFNYIIELIDISNNNIRDDGVKYLVQALIMQATDLERRSALPLQRARAIEDDEPISPVEIVAPVSEQSVETSSAKQEETEAVQQVKEVEQQQQTTAAISTAAAEEPSVCDPPVAVLVELENDVEDDNTEDTVRTLRSGNQSATGQSMLDKLLSMNSDSSSEEAPSNISTDTLAACCSEDISELSNDNYDASSKSLATSATAATTSIDESLATPATLEAAALDSSLEQLSPAQQQQLQQQQQSSQNERNLCDITPSTEAKTVEPNETCVQNNNNANSPHNNTNNNNTNNNSNSNSNLPNNNNNQTSAAAGAAAAVVLAVVPVPVAVDVSSSGSGVGAGAGTIYEVTAEESDCINGGAASGSRPLDMNKNAAKANGDDFEDTHSTDSAFESASEGDISRHLPDEFSRLSVSLESTRLDDMAKEMAIETATIASESTECLLVAAEEAVASTPMSVETATTTLTTTPKVTIAAECLTGVKEKEASASPCPSPTPTPPPPSTSPGGVSSGLRRTESSCAYLNQSTRNRSQSSDSLCSENSLDGSTSAADPQLAEKLTKNDTLSRRQLTDATAESTIRAPSGLKALALWSNNLTKNCGPSIAELLSRSSSLELLNIGKNCLSNDFVATIKESLTKNTTLTTLGLQSAHLSAKGIETLASILTFGGNSKLQRIDIRDNKLEVESLNIIAEVLKSNKTITQIDINDEPKRLTLPIVPIVNVIPPTPLPQESIGSDAHLDYTRVLGTVRSMCSRNEKMQAEELELAEMAANVGGNGSSNNSNNNQSNNSNKIGSNNSAISNRCRSGYYLGSRKISLTCHSRPLVDAATGTVIASPAAVTAAVTTAMPTPAAKLEVKRRANSTSSRLRSPGPSPPTISPSSSPNRSRFHVSRVAELSSPATSPLAQLPPQHPPQPQPQPPPTTTPRSASSCMSIPAVGSQSSLNAIAALPLPTSSSLPSMASVTSSTQTIKRLSVSPRSRFHVSRIYEDPQTPPIHLPPTPMLKSARKAAAAQLAEITSTLATATATPVTVTATTTAALPISSVIIVEPEPASTNIQEKEDQQQQQQPQETEQKLSPQCSVNSPSTSSSSCSSSPISSSTTNSSSSCCSNSSDVTDSSEAAAAAVTVPPGKSCPIAVFGDNDITLTKDSAESFALSAAASSQDVTTTTTTAAAPAPPAQRARKSSWIANPTTVDKLLTLFNPSSMFQRSSSPESKAVPVSTATGTGAPLTNNAQNTTTTTTVLGASGDVNVTLLPTRKTTPPARSNSYAIGSGGASGAAAASGATAGENAAGGSSFLDTASRQLRDFGKQVFRQNLSFNNSGDGMMALMTGSSQLEANNASGTTVMSPVAESATPPECNAMHMPLSLKRELKENISPEHTINEETLHTLQKLSRAAEDVTLKAEAAAELGDIEIVMHSEVSDCLPEAEPVQQEDVGQV